MFRLYAAHGLGMRMVRTGHALKTLAKATGVAAQLSITHPAVEIRQLTSSGNERLLDTFVGGKSLAS